MYVCVCICYCDIILVKDMSRWPPLYTLQYYTIIIMSIIVITSTPFAYIIVQKAINTPFALLVYNNMMNHISIIIQYIYK